MADSISHLASLLEERAAFGADVPDIDKRIHTMFGEKWAVVFTDMAGFSYHSATSGIIPFLALIHRMNRLCVPIYETHAGLLLKRIADSHMILFRTPRAALTACIAMQRQIDAYNQEVQPTERMYIGCGIGYGDMLKLGDDDVYGVEVNYAAKLGEDIARAYEILLTPAAARGIGRVAGVKITQVTGSRLIGSKKPYHRAEFGGLSGVKPKLRPKSKRV